MAIYIYIYIYILYRYLLSHTHYRDPYFDFMVQYKLVHMLTNSWSAKECPLDCGMLHRLFNVSWIKWYVVDFCYIYIDDILIASRTTEEHKVHIRLVLQRFVQYGILINPVMCVLGVTKLHFMGHYVNKCDWVCKNQPCERKLHLVT